jgi:predicted histidine transporter YuiF (NhaC family)
MNVLDRYFATRKRIMIICGLLILVGIGAKYDNITIIIPTL